MILIPHLIVSGVIAAKINFLPLALLLSFLSHYLLDFLPHVEYFIENIEAKKWGHSKSDFLKIGTDFFIGLLFLLLIHIIKGTDYYVLALAGFFGILPDLINFAYFFYPNNKFLKWHSSLHEKFHVLKHKKISNKWRIFSQAAVVVLALLFLF
jgi:hypothetical protein